MNKYCNQEFIGQIIDIFDDFLEEKGINIPNEEKEESENPAVFYGSDYGEVQSQIESLLYNWSKDDNVIRPFYGEDNHTLGETYLLHYVCTKPERRFPRTSHIWKCKACGHVLASGVMIEVQMRPEARYCPMCGSKFIGEEPV